MKSGKILFFLLLALLAAAGFQYLFWPDLAKYLWMRQQNRVLDERVTQEERKRRYLQEEQDALARDPVRIEKVAREKLGFSRQGDIIYKFEDKAAPGKQAPPVPVETKANGKNKK